MVDLFLLKLGLLLRSRIISHDRGRLREQGREENEGQYQSDQKEHEQTDEDTEYRRVPLLGPQLPFCFGGEMGVNTHWEWS